MLAKYEYTVVKKVPLGKDNRNASSYQHVRHDGTLKCQFTDCKL